MERERLAAADDDMRIGVPGQQKNLLSNEESRFKNISRYREVTQREAENMPVRLLSVPVTSQNAR